MRTSVDASAVLAGLWSIVAGEPGSPSRAAIEGKDPALPSVYRVGTAAAASIAAAALAAAELWRLRTGRAQSVRVDLRAAAAAFRSERYLRVDGGPAIDPWSPIAGYYETGDGRCIQLHTSFPHHRDGVLRVLGCADDRQAVAGSIAK